MTEKDGKPATTRVYEAYHYDPPCDHAGFAQHTQQPALSPAMRAIFLFVVAVRWSQHRKPTRPSPSASRRWCYGHGPQLARRARRSDVPTAPLSSKSAGQLRAFTNVNLPFGSATSGNERYLLTSSVLNPRRLVGGAGDSRAGRRHARTSRPLVCGRGSAAATTCGSSR